jgi:hypothetical protein
MTRTKGPIRSLEFAMQATWQPANFKVSGKGGKWSSALDSRGPAVHWLRAVPSGQRSASVNCSGYLKMRSLQRRRRTLLVSADSKKDWPVLRIRWADTAGARLVVPTS